MTIEEPVQTRKGDNLFRPIETGRASEQIVERFKTAIRNGELEVGDRLPPERELVDLLNVSRTTVRDALRILEARRLVTIRVGSGGGAFVTAPPPEYISQGLTDMLALSSLTATDVTEARFIIELGAIQLVCDRADAQDIADLYEICDRAQSDLKEGRLDIQTSAEYHMRLAKATHNKALEQLVLAFYEPLVASLQKAHTFDSSDGGEQTDMRGQGILEHRQIVAAIEEGDVERAQSILRTHLQRTADRVKSAG